MCLGRRWRGRRDWLGGVEVGKYKYCIKSLVVVK